MEKHSLWHFIDDKATFRVDSPESTSRLYFPLANEAGVLSSITPELYGDIKTNHNSFLMAPVTIEDLHNSKSSRNFWVYVEGRAGGQAWSATGVSALQHGFKFNGKKTEKVSLEAGVLWHKITRENTELGIKSEITNFAPVSDDACELMVVGLTNTGKSKIKITPTSAIPIFARSADNLRDHHHVTSLLHRVLSHPAGVVVKPTMSFDERGHKINETLYCVLGADANGELPAGFFSTVPDFIGEGGNLESPKAILQNLAPPQKDGTAYHGKATIGVLRFKEVALAPGEKIHFILILGITEKESKLDEWVKKFGSLQKSEAALKENKDHWSKKLGTIRFHTHDRDYDNWTRWVGLQPTLRKLFGCSFLPDFDYGRGGRGWRDLWQDCLALLLFSPSEARALLLNNFNGVRIDGSNATIISADSKEFIADRNSITRVWMDHGVWPYLTLELYVHQTGDLDILFQKARYFRDRQLWRAQKKDADWNDSCEKSLKDRKGRAVEGSILEHLLVQHLVQFFNVGEHNHIRLENADWNDGLDMAYERGESVAFTAVYGSNLKKLADLLEEIAKRRGLKKVPLAKELLLLLDRVKGLNINYDSASKKRKRLEKYFEAVQPAPSGMQTDVSLSKLIRDLREKSEFIFNHIRQKEWLQTSDGDGFYNGYYDNHGRRVEGDSPKGLRMTLTGQTFAVMSGVALHKQVEEIFKTAKKHLKDKEHGGFHLNTNFHEMRPDLGRAFSFAYGEKENGAFFSHMAVMFGNALYQRGFVKEGREVLDSIYKMCVRTEKSKIYPGIPEYFNLEGRGFYHYLTGSASWFVMTLLTQVFGVRGRYGDLTLEPKFTADDFDKTGELSVETHFAGKRLRVVYKNPKKISYEHSCITRVTLNGKLLKNVELNRAEVTIPKNFFLQNAGRPLNEIIVTLE